MNTTPAAQQALWQSAPPATQPATYVQTAPQPPVSSYPAAPAPAPGTQATQSPAYAVAQTATAPPQARTMSVVLSPVGEGRPQIDPSRPLSVADSGFSQPGVPADAAATPLPAASSRARADFNVAGPNGIDPTNVPTLNGSVRTSQSSAGGVVWRKPGVAAEPNHQTAVAPAHLHASAAPAQFQASAAPYAAPAYAAVPQGAAPQAVPSPPAGQFAPSSSHLPLQPGGMVQAVQITSLAP